MQAKPADPSLTCLQALKQRANQLLENQRGLQQQNQALSAERDAIAQERDGFQSERDQLSTQNQNLRATWDSLEAELESLATQLQEVTAKRDSIEQERNCFQVERDQLSGQLQQLTATCGALQAEHNKLTNQLQEATEQRDTLHIENYKNTSKSIDTINKMDGPTTKPGKPAQTDMIIRSSNSMNVTTTVDDNFQIKQLAARFIIECLDKIDGNAPRLFKTSQPDDKTLEVYSRISPSRHGPILHHEDEDLISASIKLYGEWAYNEISFLATLIRKGSVIIDAGAYIGTHTRAFSALAGPTGKVHSFEPNEKSFRILKANASLSEFNNIEAFQVAVGDMNGKLMLNSANQQNQGSTTLRPTSDDLSLPEVACVTLDSALQDLERADLIKFDIEGMEPEALRGSHDLIQRLRPSIYAEINSLTKAVEIFEWACKNEYVTWACIHNAFNPCNYKGLQQDIYDGGKECGLLLLSAEGPLQHVPAMPGTCTRLALDIDDLGLVLAKKPQYALQQW